MWEIAAKSPKEHMGSAFLALTYASAVGESTDVSEISYAAA